MNKVLHAVILAAFTSACSLVWFLMKLPLLLGPNHPLPGFTALCVSLRPIMIALPIMAAAYCVWIWFRKSDRLPSWTGFFAVLMSVLVLAALPAVVSAYLPLYDSRAPDIAALFSRFPVIFCESEGGEGGPKPVRFFGRCFSMAGYGHYL